MAKIKIQDYINNVELCRQKLIEHCTNNNVAVDSNSSLHNIVNTVSTINNPQEYTEETYDVLYIDIDGTVLQKTEIHSGDPTPTPPKEPNYDPEYLVFKKWVRSKGTKIIDGIDIALHDVDIGAVYDTIPIIVNGVERHPAILKIGVSSLWNNLKQTITLSTKRSKVNTYVDWGDGSGITTVATSSTYNTAAHTHTYTINGNYTIKVYADEDWAFYSNCGVLNSNRYLYSVYLSSDVYTTYGYTFYSCSNLKVVSLSSSIDSLNWPIFDTTILLKALILPDTCLTAKSDWLDTPVSLEYLILPETFQGDSNKRLNITRSFNRTMYPVNLKRLIIPDTIIGGLVSADTSFSSLQNLEVVYFAKDATILMDNSGTFDVGDTDYAQSKLKRLVLPEKLEKLSINFPSNYNIYNLKLNNEYLKEISCNLASVKFNKNSTFVLPNAVTTASFTTNKNNYDLTFLLNPSLKSLSISGAGTLINFPDTLEIFKCSYIKCNQKIVTTPINMHTCYFEYIKGIEELIINEAALDVHLPNYSNDLKKLIVNCASSAVYNYSFTGLYNLEYLKLPKDTNKDISIGANVAHLSDDNLIEIAKDLQDRTTLTSLTLSVKYCIGHRLSLILVDLDGNKTDITDPNAITLTNYIQNKNWTVSISI